MNAWESQLERDLDWRVEELASLKHQVVSQSKGSVAERSLLRAMWAMLYAHYEGFCLFALTVFLDEVRKSGRIRRHFREKLVIFSLRKAFREFRGNMSDDRCFEFFSKELDVLLDDVIDFDRDSKTQEFVLAGKSNLYPSALSENCESLCIAISEVNNHHSRLWQLVTRRNAIAHGKSSAVRDLGEYNDYENAAYDVMLDLIDSICRTLKESQHVVVPPSLSSVANDTVATESSQQLGLV